MQCWYSKDVDLSKRAGDLGLEGFAKVSSPVPSIVASLVQLNSLHQKPILRHLMIVDPGWSQNHPRRWVPKDVGERAGYGRSGKAEVVYWSDWIVGRQQVVGLRTFFFFL